MKLLQNSSYINDSKKISELRKLSYVTKHQENTWFPIAQYNSRTGSYVNAAINLQAITSYVNAYTSYCFDLAVKEYQLPTFSRVMTFDDNGEINSYSDALEISSSLTFHSLGNIITYTYTYLSDDFHTSVVCLDYDLDGSVNKDSFVFDPNFKYNLNVVDGKIVMEKRIFEEGKLLFDDFSNILEYDSNESQKVLSFNIFGELSELTFESNNLVSFDNSNVVLDISNNENVLLTYSYFNGNENKSGEILFERGLVCFYGTNVDSFENKYLFVDKIDKEITIDQQDDLYAYFACPADYKIKFIDAENNLIGGWHKYSTFSYYSFNKEYQVYRTEYSGLGKNTWKISKWQN